jgi:hypothetical protein
MMRPDIYQSKCSDTNTTNGSTSKQHPIVLSSSLDDGINVKNNHDDNQGPFTRDLVGKPGHEEATKKRAKFEHTSHEAFAETTLRLWEPVVKRVHDIDDGDDNLIVAKGEAAQRRNHGGTKNIRRADDATDARRAIADVVGKSGREICCWDHGKVYLLDDDIVIRGGLPINILRRERRG